jgi:hypothetical protein
LFQAVAIWHASRRNRISDMDSKLGVTVINKLDVRMLFFWLIIYFVIAAILVASSQYAISVSTTEIGDFAANSLLIQDAKSLDLLVGNYSRVGFNHPGPAILYVLAAGEYLLHDKLALVSFPFAGQLIAVAFYNAFWLTLVSVLLRRMGGARHVVLVAVSVFCLISSIEDHSFFNGIWFPHLYFAPFAVLLLSLARLIQEKADSLWMLAISSGFLINGHASFIAILGLMLIIVVTYSFFAGSQRGGVIRPSFIKSNSGPLLIAVLLLVLFFVPMLILTVREFPGPLGDYVAFGGGHKPNRLKAAFGFLSLYWGGRTAFLASIAAFVLLWKAKKSESIRPLLVVIAAATLAMLFYARYGVDYLDQTYIGFFYYAVPSVLAVATVIYSGKLIKSSRYVTFLSIATSLVAFSVSYSYVSAPPFYLVHYHGLQVGEINQALAKVKGDGGRIVLDLDDSNDWSHVWAMITGIGADARRQNENLFCVNRNWYISFTKRLKCTPEELKHNKRFVVRRSVEGSVRIPDIDLGGISFFEFSPPAVLIPGSLTVEKDKDLFSNYLLGSGWSVPDAMFTWSVGSRAVINLPPISTGGHVALDLGAFLPLPDSHQRVTVSVDGVEQETIEFDASTVRKKVELKPARDTGSPIQIVLQIGRPISPASVGMGQDTRLLGVALYGIEVSPAASSN